MNRVQEAVPGQAVPDRRQRKKQLTKDALIEAALELFAAKGYDHTAVHEITDAVDVSERTFFRYFASKEDLVLSFVREGTIAFADVEREPDRPVGCPAVRIVMEFVRWLREAAIPHVKGRAAAATAPCPDQMRKGLMNGLGL